MKRKPILNVSGQPFEHFSAVQRLACQGRDVEDCKARIITTLLALAKLDLRDYAFIIAPSNDPVFTNDIINWSENEVVTKDVEITVLDGFTVHNFKTYE